MRISEGVWSIITLMFFSFYASWFVKGGRGCLVFRCDDLFLFEVFFSIFPEETKTR